MRALLATASAVFFAFPAWSEPMWMLRATLCLKLQLNDAECRRITLGPYLEKRECDVRSKIVEVDATEQAEADEAEIIFFGSLCAQSNRDI